MYEGIEADLRLKLQSLASTLESITSDDFEQFAADHDYEPEDLTDALFHMADDVDHIIYSDGTYKHSRLYVGGGGPTIWIDTESSTVIGSWGTHRDQWGISEHARDAIEEVMSAYYDNVVC